MPSKNWWWWLLENSTVHLFLHSCPPLPFPTWDSQCLKGWKGLSLASKNQIHYSKVRGAFKNEKSTTVETRPNKLIQTSKILEVVSSLLACWGTKGRSQGSLCWFWVSHTPALRFHNLSFLPQEPKSLETSNLNHKPTFKKMKNRIRNFTPPLWDFTPQLRQITPPFLPSFFRKHMIFHNKSSCEI